MARKNALPITKATDTTVDLLVIGAGTGMMAALTAHELGMTALIVEKTSYVGGSTALSGGAFWIPNNPVLEAAGAPDSPALASEYAGAVVGRTSPKKRWTAALEAGPATVSLIQQKTPLKFFWAREYADYHPEKPGGSALGRSVESKPFNLRKLGRERARLRPTALAAPVPMPVTSVDYKWMNLMARKPLRGFGKIFKRAFQGLGGLVIGREYVAGGQAIAGGLYAGVLKAGIPVWTETTLTELITEGGTVVGAKLRQADREVTVRARKGVVLATGGFDRNAQMRQQYQSPQIDGSFSHGNTANEGDGIKAAEKVGAELTLMDQAWWFPSVAPLPDQNPAVLLAERSLPGCFLVNQAGKRFINESVDYMSFGQAVLEHERAGDPITKMWLIFDQRYRNSYMFAAGVFPRAPLPKEWYEAGIAHQAENPADLATKIGVSAETFSASFARFNASAAMGVDHDFGRGNSAYDRYYGDPTNKPNPTLRPLTGTLYAVSVVLGDLGTCGGVKANEHGQALDTKGKAIPGLYVIGNNAGNAYGKVYPGAGATIGQGLVFGFLAAQHANGRA